MSNAAEFVGHRPCPKCGSSDALGEYSSGWAHCFSCDANIPVTNEAEGAAPADGSPGSRDPVVTSGGRKHGLVDIGEPSAISKRGLTDTTCKFWRYHVGSYKGQPVQIANYLDDRRRVVAQKIRFRDKDFKLLGDSSKIGLYGQWLWRDHGRRVVVTEGEIDALSLSQLQGNKWPVVSVPQGAQSAKRYIARNLEWLEGFDEVVFLFDNDDPGRAAAEECAQVISPGKAKIAALPLKDANEMLVAGRAKELLDAPWSAKVYRPDSIVCGDEIWEDLISEEEVESIPYPWQGLNTKTQGIRPRELVVLCAGTGIGKSTISRELAYHLLQRGEGVGYIALEESYRKSALGIMGLHLNKPLMIDRSKASEDEMKEAYGATVGSGRAYFYDHFGSLDSERLVGHIRYMARAFDVGWVFLDHVSIVVSGIDDGDERRILDNVMTRLRSVVEETGIGLFVISHLKRPEGKGHEEGAITSLSQLRGSQAIPQLSDIVLGFERDQQDADEANVLAVRVLKNRFSGDTGIANELSYSKDTGRLTEYGGDFAETPKSEGSDTNDDF